ncbi:MAG: DUF1028 domain-containing protein [Pseudomonadota bacterium]
MTFSIAAICDRTGQIGYAVTTSSVCVGARVGRIGPDCVVFSQARTDPRLHEIGIAAHAARPGAEAAVHAMRQAATGLHWRQLGVLSRSGDGAHYTGDSCLGFQGGMAERGCLALGNFLGSAGVLPAMIAASSPGAPPLAERLIAGLRAGQAAGGENDPLQSAALKILGSDGLYDVDLRIDKSADPIEDLDSLWRDWQPKAAAYRVRAVSPDAAPSSSQVEHHGA